MNLEKHIPAISTELGIPEDKIVTSWKKYQKSWKSFLDANKDQEENVIEHFKGFLKAKYRIPTNKMQTEIIILNSNRRNKYTAFSLLVMHGNKWVPMQASCFVPIKRLDKSFIHSGVIKKVQKGDRTYYNLQEITQTDKKVENIDFSNSLETGTIVMKGDIKHFEWGSKVFLTIATDNDVFDLADDPQAVRNLERGHSVYVLRNSENKPVGWLPAKVDRDLKNIPVPKNLPVVSTLSLEELKKYHNRYIILDCVPTAVYEHEELISVKVSDVEGNTIFVRVPPNIFEEMKEKNELIETDRQGVYLVDEGRFIMIAKVRIYTGKDGEKPWVLCVHNLNNGIDYQTEVSI